MLTPCTSHTISSPTARRSSRASPTSIAIGTGPAAARPRHSPGRHQEPATRRSEAASVSR